MRVFQDVEESKISRNVKIDIDRDIDRRRWSEIKKTQKSLRISVSGDVFAKFLNDTSKIENVNDSNNWIFYWFRKDCSFNIDVSNIENNERKWSIESDDDND